MKRQPSLSAVLTVLLLLFAVVGLYKMALYYHFISLDKIIEWIQIVKQSRVLTGLFYLVYMVGVMFLPVTLFPIIGGVLFPFWMALPLNVVAATFGAWFSFLLSRAAGREIIESVLKGRLKKFDRVTSSQGMKTVFFLRLVGVPPFIVTNYALGLSGVSSRDFWIGTITGIVPWMTVVTLASNSLWEAIVVGGQKGFVEALVRTMAPLTGLSGLVLICFFIKLALNRRKEKQDAHSNL